MRKPTASKTVTEGSNPSTPAKQQLIFDIEIRARKLASSPYLPFSCEEKKMTVEIRRALEELVGKDEYELAITRGFQTMKKA